MTCNELKDSDEVVFLGDVMKWITFKDKFKKWKFTTSNKHKLNLVRAKNVKIWNYLGNEICKYYLIEKKININFIKASNKPISKIHYIVMLDRSGSMIG
jgi:predicted RNA-binding protein with PUA domain